MGILISCQAVMGHAVCVLEEFKHGIVFARMLLGNEFIVTMKICIYICSYGSKMDGFLICFRSVIVSLIFPYSQNKYMKKKLVRTSVIPQHRTSVRKPRHVLHRPQAVFVARYHFQQSCHHFHTRNLNEAVNTRYRERLYYTHRKHLHCGYQAC